MGRKSIIHVETEDVTFDEVDEFDDSPPDDGFDKNEEDMDESGGQQDGEDDAPPPAGTAGQDNIEEVKEAEEEAVAQPQQPKPVKVKKAKKRKTQITFEQYESISNAVATYLRSRESETEKVAGEEDKDSTYLTWGQVVEWHLEQCEAQIGDSLEELKSMRKLTNLVIRRLVNVDHVLVTIGDGDIPEYERKLAVHPNYVVGS